MRVALCLILICAASTGSAHVGHFGEFAGHDHWVAAGALGVAGLVAIWGVLKGRKDEPVADDPDEAEDEAAA